MKKSSIYLFVCFFLCVVGHAYAKTDTGAEKVPTTITADSMKYDPGNEQVSFAGDVHVTRPDFALRAEQLVIYFQKKDKKSGKQNSPSAGQTDKELSSVQKIVALKNVRITSQGKKGFCEKTTYWQKDGLLQMEGNPKLEDGDNQIEGEIIKLYTRDDRSEVIGGSKRVQAIFYSRPDKVE